MGRKGEQVHYYMSSLNDRLKLMNNGALVFLNLYVTHSKLMNRFRLNLVLGGLIKFARQI
jgi:hypothetical protein